ncbi:histidine kinase dimerization/phosphoacceptor domain -containing protein [Gracilimonas sp.]|uniref:histidine kinase dimerization/phosphoacceptor domain -containing protein n=1 Tax=Gracilimonas sp. TaxID=1974203 RepID=UPI0028720A5E|nr:histidine kinase dimerization/phosphoacceptor domain -containing protein [Gracilimonas sp.]
MDHKSPVPSQNTGTSQRHLMVVTTFIVAASLLVVLTTFAINMLTSTGDLNKILVRWSQSNGESVESVLNYFESGDEQFLEDYETSVKERENTTEVINELLSDNPNTDLIFREFDPEDIHPNEITGLIRIFSFFGHTSEIQQIKGTWSQIMAVTNERKALIDSLLATSNVAGASEQDPVALLQRKNQKLNNYVRSMISGSSGILFLLKRYSLWFTVLLGILIVLIGVIYTVRGIKNIKNMQSLLEERDYLAMFPKLNQFPVLNLNVRCEVDFVNQATNALFPNLKKQGLSHPFLKELGSRLHDITSGSDKTLLYEVEVDESYYQQAVHFLSEEKGLHVHSIDITELKEKQFKLTHTLKEKETLLSEVHHRVKNNMAVITGLLELQEMMGESTHPALSESRSRIKSMAIIHELLYQSDSFSEIDTSKYLAKLGEHLRLSLSNIASVKVKDQNTSQSLNINQAVPLGLLLNEIAFYLCTERSEDDKRLELELQIISKNDSLCLKITSEQPGVSNPLNTTDKPTLRISLIKNLLAQIEGELIMPESDHLSIEIEFSPNIKKGSSSTLIN